MDPNERQGAMGGRENIALVKRFYKSLEDGGIAAYFGLLTPDAETHLVGNTPVSGVPRHGTDRGRILRRETPPPH